MITLSILVIFFLCILCVTLIISKKNIATQKTSLFATSNTEKPDIGRLLSSNDINNSIIDLWDYIFQLCKYGENLPALNEFQKNFYFNQVIEHEINNGGFHQYFFNSSGDNAQETVMSLKAIGAEKTASILEKAISRFPDKTVHKEWSRRQEDLKKISDELNAFMDLDSEFLKYEDDLNLLNIEYVKKNKKDFLLQPN